MTTPTLQQLQDARKIIDVLYDRTRNKDEWESIRYVYNEAIGDAASFLDELVKHNPQGATTLMAAANEIRTWLLIPDRMVKE